jgi:hypothetical protein
LTFFEKMGVCSKPAFVMLVKNGMFVPVIYLIKQLREPTKTPELSGSGVLP